MASNATLERLIENAPSIGIDDPRLARKTMEFSWEQLHSTPLPNKRRERTLTKMVALWVPQEISEGYEQMFKEMVRVGMLTKYHKRPDALRKIISWYQLLSADQKGLVNFKI